MPDITLIDAGTGRILQTSNVPPGDVHLQNIRWVDGNPVADNSVIILEGRHDGRTEYWQDGEFIPRPKVTELTEATIEGSGADELTFPGIPEGTQVFVDFVDVGTVDDGVLIYASNEPGEHEIWLRPPFPWQSANIRVTVT